MQVIRHKAFRAISHVGEASRRRKTPHMHRLASAIGERLLDYEAWHVLSNTIVRRALDLEKAFLKVLYLHG